MLYSRIKIGNNVFIGFDCTILLNTTIGNNCIIGAGSVVRGNFPDNSVIIGNPAKVVMTSSVQKFLFKNNPGLLKTRKLPQPLKTQLSGKISVSNRPGFIVTDLKISYCNILNQTALRIYTDLLFSDYFITHD